MWSVEYFHKILVIFDIFLDIVDKKREVDLIALIIILVLKTIYISNLF